MAEEVTPPELESELDALYRQAPREFTAARNDLVRFLRKQKRKDDAARIAKLNKPTAAAWSLNQIARDRPDLIEDLLHRGALLRQIQERVMRGEAETPLLLLASEERRAAVRAVVQAIGDTLGDGEARRNDDWVRTLEAASVDDRLATSLKLGRFSSVVLEAVGFDGLLVGADPVPRHLTIVPPRSEEGALPAAEHAAAERERTRRIELAKTAEADARQAEAAATAAVALAREARVATERTIAEAEALLAVLTADLHAARDTEQTAESRYTVAATALESASAAVTIATSVDESPADPIARGR